MPYQGAMARSVGGIRPRRTGPGTKHGRAQENRKSPILVQKMPGRAVPAGSMMERPERMIRSVIGDNFVAGNIGLDPSNTEGGQIMFKITDMPKHADVRGLSTAGVYVTGIATH